MHRDLPALDLANFGLGDVAACSKALRACGLRSQCMEQAGQEIVQLLYDSLTDSSTSHRACALVRYFTTYPYELLPAQLQDFAHHHVADHLVRRETKCMVLLGTTGDEQDWQERTRSKQHQSIPLVSVDFVERMPMISQLVKQLGFDLSTVLKPSPELFIEPEQTSYGVFYVPEALGSPFIPDQTQFVIPYNVRSVLGFGGMLPSGNMFSVILFSRVSITQHTADLFKILALSVKVAVLPFDGILFRQDTKMDRAL